MSRLKDRMLVWINLGRTVVVEPEDVYWLEVDGPSTWVRQRGLDTSVELAH